MAIRITIVVALSGFLSYVHIMQSLEVSLIDGLEKYIRERGLKESQIFQLAQANQNVVKDAFVQRWQSFKQRDHKTDYARLFKLQEDKTTRLDIKAYQGLRRHDGSLSSGISGYVGAGAPVQEREFQQKLLLSYYLLDKYGDTWRHIIPNLYISMPENVNLVYWPGEPWGLSADSKLDITLEEWAYVANLQNNPKRLPAWTGLYFDPTADEWMVSCETPVDIGGQHKITIGHDILLSSVFDKVYNDHLVGAHNMIIRNDGRLIAAADYEQELRDSGGVVNIKDLNAPDLLAIFEQLKSSTSGGRTHSQVVYNATIDSYIAFTQIEGPDWFFVTVYPKALLASSALKIAEFVVLLGLASLLLEIFLLYRVIIISVVGPLKTFVAVSDDIREKRDFDAVNRLPLERLDEVGYLAKAFASMAKNVKDYTVNLESVVQKRTQKLHQLSITDALTGLLNRRGVVKALQKKFDFAKRSNEPLALAIIDIDFFKKVNDSYGHQVGDQVITKITEIINDCLGPDDVCSRWGGEEFLLGFNLNHEKQLHQICQSIVSIVADTPIPVEKQHLNITVSLGAFYLNEANLHNNLDLELLIKQADHALYAAKHQGRNQFVIHQDISQNHEGGDFTI